MHLENDFITMISALTGADKPHHIVYLRSEALFRECRCSFKSLAILK